MTPPVQQQKQQQWVLSWSINSQSTKEVGWVEKKKQAAAAQRVLEQLCQFQRRGATSGLSHKNLNPGFNTAHRISSQHWFGVLKVCLCLFFYIATSDDCTSAGWNICELLSWDVLVSSTKGAGDQAKLECGSTLSEQKTKWREREREGAVLTGLGFWTGFGPLLGSGKLDRFYILENSTMEQPTSCYLTVPWNQPPGRTKMGILLITNSQLYLESASCWNWIWT